MRKLRAVYITSVALLFATNVFATDLVEVYKQALDSDPAFKAANASWLALRENTPIARASLLPSLSATAGYSRNISGGWYESDSKKFADAPLNYYNSTTYGLSLAQPLFNFSSWAALSYAKATVKQAAADFSAAAQDLMYRSASAYFAVLLSEDVLRCTSEQRKNVGEQLRQQKQRYAVGIAPITDVNNAQASYDSITAQEIVAQNDVQVQKEKLQEITGVKYTELKKFKSTVPLVSPAPKDMEQWVKTAEQQSYALTSARYAAIAARESVKTQLGRNFPTLSLNGGYSYSYTRYSTVAGDHAANGLKSAAAGLSLNIPIFSGGSVIASTRQADYNYQQAIAVQEKVHRNVMSNTRQAYLGVMSGISKIIADKQMIISKRSSYLSTLNSYDAGLRTMSDVLSAESALYDAERTYAQDQYSYILSTLALKQNAGMLSFTDIEKVNNWLDSTAAKKIAVVRKKNDGLSRHLAGHLKQLQSLEKENAMGKQQSSPSTTSATTTQAL